MDAPDDPLMRGLEQGGIDIEDTPIDVMTPEELAKEGLKAFGVDLIDKLGLDELEIDTKKDEQQESAQPRLSALPPHIKAVKRPDPKEWFVYADEAFNL